MDRFYDAKIFFDTKSLANRVMTVELETHTCTSIPTYHLYICIFYTLLMFVIITAQANRECQLE